MCQSRQVSIISFMHNLNRKVSMKMWQLPTYQTDQTDEIDQIDQTDQINQIDQIPPARCRKGVGRVCCVYCVCWVCCVCCVRNSWFEWGYSCQNQACRHSCKCLFRGQGRVNLSPLSIQKLTVFKFGSFTSILFVHACLKALFAIKVYLFRTFIV